MQRCDHSQKDMAKTTESGMPWPRLFKCLGFPRAKGLSKQASMQSRERVCK